MIIHKYGSTVYRLIIMGGSVLTFAAFYIALLLLAELITLPGLYVMQALVENAIAIVFSLTFLLLSVYILLHPC